MDHQTEQIEQAEQPNGTVLNLPDQAEENQAQANPARQNEEKDSEAPSDALSQAELRNAQKSQRRSVPGAGAVNSGPKSSATPVAQNDDQEAVTSQAAAAQNQTPGTQQNQEFVPRNTQELQDSGTLQEQFETARPNELNQDGGAQRENESPHNNAYNTPEDAPEARGRETESETGNQKISDQKEDEVEDPRISQRAQQQEGLLTDEQMQEQRDLQHQYRQQQDARQIDEELVVQNAQAYQMRYANPIGGEEASDLNMIPESEMNHDGPDDEEEGYHHNDMRGYPDEAEDAHQAAYDQIHQHPLHPAIAEEHEGEQYDSQNMYFQIDDTIARKVEQERLDKIYYESHNLVQQLAMEDGRCPTCTLKPPCKHLDAPLPVEDANYSMSNRMKAGHDGMGTDEQIFNENLQYIDNQLREEQMKKAAEPGEHSHRSSNRNSNHNQHSGSRVPSAAQKQTRTTGEFNAEGNTNAHTIKFYNIEESPRLSRIDDLKEHHNKINNIVGHGLTQSEMQGLTSLGLKSPSQNQISPYSILRQSQDGDLKQTVSKLHNLAVQAKHGGARSTRTEVLRQLALKQKIAQNPFLCRKVKITKEVANQMSLDPLTHLNDFQALDPGMMAFKLPRARQRNRRGEYQSIDFTDNSGSLAGGNFTGRTGSLTAQGTGRNRSASKLSSFRHHNDISKAEDRLRTIEQISRYREEKIKREFLKLEEELRLEEEKNRKEHERDQRLQQYFLMQKQKIYEYQKIKQMKQQAEQQAKREDLQRDFLKDQLRLMRNEENKAKLRIYREMKAQEIMQAQHLQREQILQLMHGNPHAYDSRLNKKKMAHARDRKFMRSVDFQQFSNHYQPGIDHSGQREVAGVTNGERRLSSIEDQDQYQDSQPSPFDSRMDENVRNMQWGAKGGKRPSNEYQGGTDGTDGSGEPLEAIDADGNPKNKQIDGERNDGNGGEAKAAGEQSQMSNQSKDRNSAKRAADSGESNTIQRDVNSSKENGGQTGIGSVDGAQQAKQTLNLGQPVGDKSTGQKQMQMNQDSGRKPYPNHYSQPQINDDSAYMRRVLDDPNRHDSQRSNHTNSVSFSPTNRNIVGFDKKKHQKHLEKERVIRQTINAKIESVEREDDMKPIKYKGGKVLYRSIAQPLKLYAHGMRIVDITNPNNQKELKNRYVLKYSEQVKQHEFGIKKNPSQKVTKSRKRGNKTVIFNSAHLRQFQPKDSPPKVRLPKQIHLKPLRKDKETVEGPKPGEATHDQLGNARRNEKDQQQQLGDAEENPAGNASSKALIEQETK